METSSSGAVVLFHQAHFSGFFFSNMDSWALIELNFRRQIMRADLQRYSVK